MGGFCRGFSSDFSNPPAQILPEMGPDIRIPKTLQVEIPPAVPRAALEKHSQLALTMAGETPVGLPAAPTSSPDLLGTAAPARCRSSDLSLTPPIAPSS